MSRLVDELLAGLTGDEKLDLWARVEEVHRVRSLDPELRARLKTLLLKIPEDRASEICTALDEVDPHAVLDAYLSDFLEAKYGSSPKGPVFALQVSAVYGTYNVPDTFGWYAAEPTRLRCVVESALTIFPGLDLRRVVEFALGVADRAGIDPLVAEAVILSALRTRKVAA